MILGRQCSVIKPLRTHHQFICVEMKGGGRNSVFLALLKHADALSKPILEVGVPLES